MANMGSVSRWIVGLKNQDPQAAAWLWRRYATRVLRLAAKRLRHSPQRVADEEDVAAVVFDALYRGAARGQFPRLDNRSDLWALLVRITERKAIDAIRREQRLKRGGGALRARVLPIESGSVGRGRAAAVADPQPGPKELAELADECRAMLDALDDDVLRAIAVLKLEGRENTEIAARLRRPLRTIERKVALIRTIWKARAASNGPTSVTGLDP